MIQTRPVQEKDMLFIEKVYRSTREEELSQANWSELQKDAFIMMQSVAQDAEYNNTFPNAVFEIIEYKKKPAGRLYTGETVSELRLIDITILPEFRGKGIGTRILKSLIENAAGRKKLLTLHVEPSNPALYLYLRLGFIHINSNGSRYFMEYRP